MSPYQICYPTLTPTIMIFLLGYIYFVDVSPILNTMLYFVRKLKETPNKYEMLLFTSLFPQGVSVEDLHFLCEDKKIPSNWKTLMSDLTLGDDTY